MAAGKVRQLLQALDDLAHAGPPAGAAAAIVEATRSVVGADGVLVTGLSGGAPVEAWSWPGGFFTRADQETFETVIATDPYPLVGVTRSGPGSAVRLSDLLSDREYRSSRVYSELLRGLSVSRQLAYSVPVGADRSLCIAMGRDGPDFTDADCDRINALRGPLATAIRSRDHAGATAAQVASTSPLSRRELEVLSLAASGLSDVQISRRLGITPRTAGKHLEHIYRKTATTNRTEAAARLYAVAPPQSHVDPTTTT